MGDIGGQLGLFIGVSVMTVCETAFLIVELATLCCRVPHAKRKGREKYCCNLFGLYLCVVESSG